MDLSDKVLLVENITHLNLLKELGYHGLPISIKRFPSRNLGSFTPVKNVDGLGIEMNGNIKEPGMVVVLDSHLSRWAVEIIELVKERGLMELHIIHTLMNELSHVEQLDWHPEWLGVWSLQPDAKKNNIQDIPGTIRNDDLGYFSTIEARLRVLLAKDARIVIEYHPFSTCWYGKDVFLLGAYFDLFPSLDHEYPSYSSHVDLSQIPTKTRDFASVISTFLDDLDMCESCYTVGPMSREIGECLADQSQNSKRRNSERTAGLVIVDRTLDLVGPSLYSTNMLDLVYDTFPREAPHSVQCMLDLNDLGFDQGLDPDSQIPLFAFEQSLDMDRLFNNLMNVSENQALRALESELSNFCSQHLENFGGEVDFDQNSNKAASDNLAELSSKLKNQPLLLFEHEALTSHLYSISTAFCNNITCRQELQSAEKVIVALLAQTRETSHIFYQLHDMLAKITKEKQSNVSDGLATRDILLLALHMYSMVGETVPIEPQHEIYLQKAFIKAMIASNAKANVRAVSAWISKVFGQLSRVSKTRSFLKDPYLSNLLDFDQAYPYTPFLVKLSNEILKEQKAKENSGDIYHVEYQKTISNVLSGFSRLLGTPRQTHPSDFQTVILFLVGGISFQEITILREFYKRRNIRVIIGSNTISNRDSMMQQIFKSK